MQSIHPDRLATVLGGAGEAGGAGMGILGGLIGQAPGILNGIASIIGAAKSGRGGGAEQPQAAPPTQGAAAMAAAASVGVPQQPDPRVSVTVGHF